MGEWDYINNKDGVNKVLKSRVDECAPFENVYTLALRGLHDRAMNASNNMSDRKEMLQEALMAQRQMLVDAIGKRAEDIPQAFTPYKEVLDVYDQGLETITLSPGEQAVVFANSSTKRKVDLEEYVGWVDGMYIFNNRPLGDIMKTFERWYDIQVYYETPNLRDITYSGNLKRYGTINSFLDALELTGDLTYKISGRNILIYDKVEEQEWKR